MELNKKINVLQFQIYLKIISILKNINNIGPLIVTLM